MGLKITQATVFLTNLPLSLMVSWWCWQLPLRILHGCQRDVPPPIQSINSCTINHSNLCYSAVFVKCNNLRLQLTHKLYLILQLMDYIYDLPTLLRQLFRDLFSVGGLVWVLRLRIILCFFAAALYFVSPLDIIPESVFGFLGLLDDVLIILLLLVYVTEMYRRVIANRAEETMWLLNIEDHQKGERQTLKLAEDTVLSTWSEWRKPVLGMVEKPRNESVQKGWLELESRENEAVDNYYAKETWLRYQNCWETAWPCSQISRYFPFPRGE